MSTRRDEEKLREVADKLAPADPAHAAQLYADADYLAQLRKAPVNVSRDEAGARSLDQTQVRRERPQNGH